MSACLEGRHTGRTDIILLSTRARLLAAGFTPREISELSMADAQLIVAAKNAEMVRLGQQIAHAMAKALTG